MQPPRLTLSRVPTIRFCRGDGRRAPWHRVPRRREGIGRRTHLPRPPATGPPQLPGCCGAAQEGQSLQSARFVATVPSMQRCLLALPPANAAAVRRASRFRRRTCGSVRRAQGQAPATKYRRRVPARPAVPTDCWAPSRGARVSVVRFVIGRAFRQQRIRTAVPVARRSATSIGTVGMEGGCQQR